MFTLTDNGIVITVRWGRPECSRKEREREREKRERGGGGVNTEMMEREGGEVGGEEWGGRRKEEG